MQKKQRRRMLRARIVMVLLLALAFVGIGGARLENRREDAESAWYGGTSVYSVYDDLRELEQISYNMLQIAEDAHGDSGAYRAARNAWNDFSWSYDPYERGVGYKALVPTLDQLGATITDPDALEQWKKQESRLIEYESHLKFDSYYDQAAVAFNELLGNPWTAVLARLTDCKPMPRFNDL